MVSLSTAAILGTLSHIEPASARNLVSFPLQFLLLYFLENSWTAELQVLSSPHAFWKYFSTHKSSFWNTGRFIEICTVSHKLYLWCPPTTNRKWMVKIWISTSYSFLKKTQAMILHTFTTQQPSDLMSYKESSWAVWGLPENHYVLFWFVRFHWT